MGLASILLTVLAAATPKTGDSAFTVKPTVATVGDQTKIAFTLAAPSDVEVAITDQDGKVVRHLAAGVLGGDKAPPEPFGPGLAQELVWDGRDDFGKKARGQAFSVQVSAGMKPVFDGFMMYHPAASGRIVAVAVGPGTLPPAASAADMSRGS